MRQTRRHFIYTSLFCLFRLSSQFNVWKYAFATPTFFGQTSRKCQRKIHSANRVFITQHICNRNSQFGHTIWTLIKMMIIVCVCVVLLMNHVINILNYGPFVCSSIHTPDTKFHGLIEFGFEFESEFAW